MNYRDGNRDRENILLGLSQASHQTINWLAGYIGRSRSTVRRDLATLDELGYVEAHSGTVSSNDRRLWWRLTDRGRLALPGIEKRREASAMEETHER